MTDSSKKKLKIGEIPTLRIAPGEQLCVDVCENSLDQGARMSAVPVAAPADEFRIESHDGNFRFIPKRGETGSFNVTFTATNEGRSESQTVEVQVVPEASVSLQFIDERARIPARDSTNYISESEQQRVEKEMFNAQERNTRSVHISGMTLVLEKGHENQLHCKYHGQETIREVYLYADEVTIRSPLALPGTDVTVYARVLRFEDGDGAPACIDTTPVSYEQASTEETKGQEDPGQRGGNINLHINEWFQTEVFDDEGKAIPRFILDGGQGRPGKAGQPQHGDNLKVWDRKIPQKAPWQDYYVDEAYYKEVVGEYEPVAVFGTRGMEHLELCQTYKDMKWPGDGQAPDPPPTRPGNGGRGGIVGSTAVSFEKYARFNGGPPGKTTQTDRSRAGTPIKSCILQVTCRYPAIHLTTYLKRFGTHVSEPGPPVATPVGDPGEDGGIVPIDDRTSWLHPYGVRCALNYAQDLYLAGARDDARRVFSLYSSILEKIGSDHPHFDELHCARSQVKLFLSRLDRNLDYFGNPAGWAPMLSFEAHLRNYRNEIDSAIEVLYLSYWINHEYEKAQSKSNSLKEAIRRLKSDTEDAIDSFNSFVSELPRLQSDMDAIENDIRRVEDHLEELEQHLRQKAEDWQKIQTGIRVLKTIATVIPVAQPALGLVGSALSNLKLDTPSTVAEWRKLRPPADEDLVSALNEHRRMLYGDADEGVAQTSTTSDGDAEKPEDQSKSTLEFVAELSGKTGNALKAIDETMSSLRAPQQEIDAYLEGFKASDPAYREVVTQIENLNLTKANTCAKLGEVMEGIADCSNRIADNVMAMQSLGRQMRSSLSKLEHQARLDVQMMERRAKDRLLKFHYGLVKAYQYRMVQPFPKLDYSLGYLFEKLEKILRPDLDGRLEKNEFKELKTVYLEQLRAITTGLVDWYNDNHRKKTNPVRFNLTQDQLNALNSDSGRVVLDFADRLDLSQENQRLLNVRIVDAAFAESPSGGQWVNVNLKFVHPGMSYIRHDGRFYVFRHFTSESREGEGMTWGTTLSTDGTSLEIADPQTSPFEESLIQELLESREGDFLTNYVPSAWGLIVLKRTGDRLSLSELVIECQIEYADARNEVALYARALNGPRPQIKCTRDLHGNAEGQGEFFGVYRKRSRVILETPKQYEGLQFRCWKTVVGWDYDGGDVVGEENRITFDLNTSKRLFAQYEPSASA